jgi:hypothetical protein
LGASVRGWRSTNARCAGQRRHASGRRLWRMDQGGIAGRSLSAGGCRGAGHAGTGDDNVSWRKGFGLGFGDPCGILAGMRAGQACARCGGIRQGAAPDRHPYRCARMAERVSPSDQSGPVAGSGAYSRRAFHAFGARG